MLLCRQNIIVLVHSSEVSIASIHYTSMAACWQNSNKGGMIWINAQVLCLPKQFEGFFAMAIHGIPYDPCCPGYMPLMLFIKWFICLSHIFHIWLWGSLTITMPAWIHFSWVQCAFLELSSWYTTEERCFSSGLTSNLLIAIIKKTSRTSACPFRTNPAIIAFHKAKFIRHLCQLTCMHFLDPSVCPEGMILTQQTIRLPFYNAFIAFLT